MPEDPNVTSRASMYADDNSAGEEAKTVDELKEKTEAMLTKIFSHMRSSRLLVNPDKTKIMLMATYQKRSKNNLVFEVNVEGTTVKEATSAYLLGVTISNDFSWDEQVKETIK